jgi:hypothetical protein
VLVFVDADTTVTGTAVGAALTAVRAGAVGGGCAIKLRRSVATPWARAGGHRGAAVPRAQNRASGCFLFCTRTAFHAVGGFDETLFAAEEAAMSRALRRHGRFVILRESVTTSGRKLRAYSGREVLGIMVRLLLEGRAAVRRPDGLDVWYGERRADPESDA